MHNIAFRKKIMISRKIAAGNCELNILSLLMCFRVHYLHFTNVCIHLSVVLRSCFDLQPYGAVSIVVYPYLLHLYALLALWCFWQFSEALVVLLWFCLMS